MLSIGTAAEEGRNRMNEYEVERDELLYIINECIDNANNQDLRTILDCLNEIGLVTISNNLMLLDLQDQ